jgi:hypothetical protein
MKLVMKKSEYAGRLQRFRKRRGEAPENKLEYFRKLIREHLASLEKEDEEGGVSSAMRKALNVIDKLLAKGGKGLPVGTIREWKGKKYVKASMGSGKTPGTWRRKYDSQSRGAKMAIAAIKRKVDAATSVQELLQIVLENRDRFSDAQGNPLPFVQELSAYVSGRMEITSGRGHVSNPPPKPRPAPKPRPEPKETEEPETKADNAAAFKAIQETYQSAKAVEGEQDEIAVGKEVVGGRWRLVEADTPVASHNEQTFNKTKGFPTTGDGSTINDRDYEKDQAAQEIVIDIGMDYDTRALSFDSPVVVTQDGIVISGNNRTMSSKIAARQGTDAAYIEALKKKARKFGFTSEDVAQFKHPRVIFQPDEHEEYSTALFAKYNSDDKKAMNPIEEAVKVSKLIKGETVETIAMKIADFETLGELYADKRAPREMFDTLMAAGLIGKNQLPKYYTEQTGITGDGKNFIETALLGSVMSESNIRGLNREGCKNIRQKLVRAITPLVENKGMDGYSITKELNSGVDIAMQAALLKDTFHSVTEFVSQGTMFEKLDPLAIEFAKKLEGTQKSFAEFMRVMNGGLKYAANGEADVFLGEVESREAILERMLGARESIGKAVDGVLRFFAGLRNGRGNFERKKVLLNRDGEKVEDYRWVMRKAQPDSTLALEKQAIAPHAELVREKTIAVDFDGVINSYTSGWKGATETDEPVLSAATAIDGLFNRGYKLVIFSTRANTPEGVQTIREYLRKHTENNELADTIEITDQKPIADMYIDDRAIPFTGDWTQTLEQIETFKPWIEKSLTYSGFPLQDRTKVQGMDISIENKKGSTRSGVDKDGHEWHTTMRYDYGYIRGTVGTDKDHLDAYVGPNPESEIVYIVNQNDPVTGAFDEQKVMLGFTSEAEAKAAYLKQYDRPGFFGGVMKMDIDTFKEEAFNAKNKGKPLKRRAA